MATDSWARVAAASKRQQSTLQSQFDLYVGFDDFESGEDDSRAEFPCPFCSDEFDVIGLCCHIDEEHPVEAKNGVCPVCTARVGMDIVGHMATQHGNFFKMQRRRRLRKGSSGSHSTLSLLKKELRDGNLHYLLGGSSHGTPPLNAAPDPLLSSFINSLPSSDSPKDAEHLHVDEEKLVSSSLDQKVSESVEPSLSDKDQKERAQRSEFARELVLSTIFRDSS